jgi:mRNA interferase MazF
VKRGEVWWAEEPEEGPRPYLILTRDEAIGKLNKLVVAPATRTIWGIPTEVEIGREEGLNTDSVLSLDNVTLIRKTFLIERMGALRPQKMVEVCAALVSATNCG